MNVIFETQDIKKWFSSRRKLVFYFLECVDKLNFRNGTTTPISFKISYIDQSLNNKYIRFIKDIKNVKTRKFSLDIYMTPSKTWFISDAFESFGPYKNTKKGRLEVLKIALQRLQFRRIYRIEVKGMEMFKNPTFTNKNKKNLDMKVLQIQRKTYNTTTAYRNPAKTRSRM